MKRITGAFEEFADTQGGIEKFLNEVWRNDDGEFDNPLGPALVAYDLNPPHHKRLVKYYDRGTLHREGGPAVTTYDLNGKLFKEEWYQHGARHREDGPAVIFHHETEDFYEVEGWYIRGLEHRIGGPSRVVREEDGRVSTEIWSVHGKMHRADGPAYFENEGCLVVEYYLNGEKVEPPPFAETYEPQVI